MSEAHELRARIVAAALAWRKRYELIEAGETDDEYAYADIDFMGEVQELAGRLEELLVPAEE